LAFGTTILTASPIIRQLQKMDLEPMQSPASTEAGRQGNTPSASFNRQPSPPEFIGADYRAALSLNNTGVSLLERGAYHLALPTFKDSLSVLRQMYCHHPMARRNDNPVVSCALSLADQRLASTFNRTSMPPPVTSNVLVKSISHDGTSFQGHISAMTHVYQPDVFFPARIDGSPSSIGAYDFKGVSATLRDGCGLDFQCALILYNCALAHLCLARNGTSRHSPHEFKTMEYAQPLRQSATKLFHKVQFILCGVLEDTMMSLWMEESRLVLTCLSLAHEAGHCQQVGFCRESERRSYQLRVAVDAWLQWNEFLSYLLGLTHADCDGNPPTQLDLALTAPHRNNSSQKLVLLRHRMLLACAA
jgi:hypothetical protein